MIPVPSGVRVWLAVGRTDMGLRRVDLTKARRHVVTKGQIDGNSQVWVGRRDLRKPLRGEGRP